HLYVIRLKLDEIEKTHLEVFESLRKQGVGVNLHYIPVHTQPFYERMGFSVGDFPEAEAYYREAISLPMYHTLSLEQQDKVVEA
ncbi:DegT/DnrJ/EryC1/StrS family aminotransferase, partial [Pseudomonas aeruginosa]